MQLVRSQVDDKRHRILVVGKGVQGSPSVDVSYVPTIAEAAATLADERFEVLVVDRGAGTKDEVRRLARLDSEMFLLVAADESDLASIGAFSHECGADGIVRLPLSRHDVASAVDRATRLGSRVANCVKLYELCRSLLGTLKQRDLVRTVLDVAPRVLPADNVALFLLSSFCESPAAFECHATEPPPPELRGLLAEVTSLVSRHGAMLCDEVMVDGRNAAPTEWRWLGCPLLGSDGVGGAVVFLRSRESDPFSPVERQSATTFAASVASALENSRDYRELETKVRALSRERQRAIAREAVSIAVNLGGAVAHEVTNAMTVVASNVDALAAAAQDQELWRVAKEAAEYLLQQGEPTGQRLAARIFDAGGARNTDGLVTEIAGMIDECLEGVRRVSEMARGLGGQSLPPPRPMTSFDVADALRAPLVAASVVHRSVIFRNTSVQQMVASRSDVEEALSCVLRALDSDAHAVEAQRASTAAAPLVVRVVDVRGVCTVIVDAPVPVVVGGSLQSLLAPKLRVQPGNVVRLDASLSFAHALLARNGLDLWVEGRADGGVSLFISASDFAA